MSIWLMVLREDGEDSYSLWGSFEAAQEEIDYQQKVFHRNRLNFKLFEMEVN